MDRNDQTEKNINTVLKLLVDTGVLSKKDAYKIPTHHPNTVLRYLREHAIIMQEDFTEAHRALSVLLAGGHPTLHLDAKLTLVRLITKNVHQRIEKQRRKTHEQKEKITRETQPAVPRVIRAATRTPKITR